MKKSVYTFLYLLALLSAGLTIHQAFAQRAPSVEPLMEIDIETPSKAPIEKEKGYDFNHQNDSKRLPANVTKKSDYKSPYSFIGPLLFLCALPIALWIVISKRFGNKTENAENVGYYPKTLQMKPKSHYEEDKTDEDDIDYPKAS